MTGAEKERALQQEHQKARLDFAALVGMIARSLPPGPLVEVVDRNGKTLRIDRQFVAAPIARGIYALPGTAFRERITNVVPQNTVEPPAFPETGNGGGWFFLRRP